MGMKKIFSIVLVIILFIASSLIFWAGLAPASFKSFFSMYPQMSQTLSEPISSLKGQLSIRGNLWSVDIANNENSRSSGLSNRKSLRMKDGLLFAFDKLDKHIFWMKDMLISIDMIFFDDNWEIVLIESNLQPNSFPKIFGDKVKSQYVLEINALEADSYGLQVGDRAIFLNK